jgi:hypothetical protein
MSDIHNGFESFFKDVSFNPNIIPFNEKHSIDKTKDHIVIVDSKDRDVEKYPKRSAYAINFNEPFENVVSVEVLNTRVIFNESIINQTNNILKLTFSDDGGSNVVTTEIKLPTLYGNYTSIHGYIDSINKLFLNDPDAYDLYVTLTDNKFTFKSKHNLYEINFLDNISLANLLGFSDKLYRPVLNTDRLLEISSELPITILDLRNDYIIMTIKDINIYKSNNKVLNKATSIIYETPDSSHLNYIESIKKRFNPPISIFNFNVKFCKHSGELYNFDSDHTIQLKITTLKQGRRA